MVVGVDGVGGVNVPSYVVEEQRQQDDSAITHPHQTEEGIVPANHKKLKDVMNRVAQVVEVVVEAPQAPVVHVSDPLIRTEQNTSIHLQWYGMQNWQGKQKHMLIT